MRFDLCQLSSNQHQEMVTACCWTPENDVVTCSDDKTIVKWRMNGEVSGKVATIEDTYITCVDWIPSIGRKGAEVFVIACTDGTFRIISKNGREEKKVQATDNGAVISLRWNYDGSALVTAGEDGSVKVWSKSGNLRSTLAQAGNSVYTVVWGPDDDQILFSSGHNLIIKTIQVGRKQVQWKAHDGVVMKVDWNPINNQIISGGEDRVFRVWDGFGRQLYQSPIGEYVITSLAWSPNGEMFAVGSYNNLRLCDKTGWTFCRDRPKSGSLMDIKWASDGTQLVGAGGNGATVFAQVVERTLTWKNIEVTLIDAHKINVQDVSNETFEELDFARDRVIEMSLGYGYLVVATSTQCFLYSTQNWNTPHIFDLRSAVNLIIQSEKHFIATDNFNGIQVYNYEGRVISNPKFPGLRVEFLNHQTISLSTDTISILDHSDRKIIRSFDIFSGRQLSNVITHSLEVCELALSQYGANSSDRKLLLIDLNRDLYITPISSSVNKTYKLHSQVDSAKWNNASETLVAIADSKLVTWSYPNIVYIDVALLKYTCEVKDGSDFLKRPFISTFIGNKVTIRRTDGALLTASTSPYPAMLYEFVAMGNWEKAVRLCRFVKTNELWACLSGMALSDNHLDTAEIALANLNEVDKLYFILYVKEIPSVEGRNAELALFKKNPQEAENILLQAQPPLIYQAIKMNIRLFRWNRALDLAIKHKTHVDTVLAYREQYLDANRLEENDERFKQYSKQVTIDIDAIAAKKLQEKEKEMAHGGKDKRK